MSFCAVVSDHAGLGTPAMHCSGRMNNAQRMVPGCRAKDGDVFAVSTTS